MNVNVTHELSLMIFWFIYLVINPEEGKQENYGFFFLANWRYAIKKLLEASHDANINFTYIKLSKRPVNLIYYQRNGFWDNVNIFYNIRLNYKID